MNISPVVPAAVWEWVKIQELRIQEDTTVDVKNMTRQFWSEHVEDVSTDEKKNEQRERKMHGGDSENDQVDRLEPSM